MSLKASDPPVLSYSSHVVPPRWACWLMRPIGWPYFTLAGLTAFWIFWQFRLPKPHPISRAALFIVLFVAAIWFLRLGLRLVLFRIYRRPWRELRVTLWRYEIPVLVAALVYACLHYDLPEAWAWRLSEPALRSHAQEIIAAESAGVASAKTTVPYPAQWVGLYKFERVQYWADGHVVAFFISGYDGSGFAYCPGGLPAGPLWRGMRMLDITPLGGDWYRVELVSMAYEVS
jgi:hypothetical protein